MQVSTSTNCRIVHHQFQMPHHLYITRISMADQRLVQFMGKYFLNFCFSGPNHKFSFLFSQNISNHNIFCWIRFVLKLPYVFVFLFLFSSISFVFFFLYRCTIRHSIYAAPSSHALAGARNSLHHGVATYPHVDSYSNPYLFGPNAYSPPAAARPNLSPHSPIGTITVGSASQNSNNTSISAQSVLPGMHIMTI